MGLLDKVESAISLGILAIAGYVFIVNYQTIKELWCKIPGMCIDRGEILECKLTANDCWNQNGPYSQVDLTNCSCTPSITPPKTCNPSYLELATCKLSGHDWNYNPEVCACDDYKPPSEQEVCEMFGKVWDGTQCITPPNTSLKTCQDGTQVPWGQACPGNAPCYEEIPSGSGCYPYAESPGGEHCNVNCNTRCSDSAGNYKPCDIEIPWWEQPCPEGQVRDSLAPFNCVNDNSGCMINMQNGGWMSLETWQNSPGLWAGNTFLGDNGQCSP